MARPRTATAVLDARGAFKVNPERKRPKEPEAKTPFPTIPPATLTAAEKKCWRQIVKIAPGGVLTGADVVKVEITARLMAEMREDFSSMSVGKLGRLSQELDRLGLSPSGRAGLVVEKPKENDFDDV